MLRDVSEMRIHGILQLQDIRPCVQASVKISVVYFFPTSFYTYSLGSLSPSFSEVCEG